MTEPSRAPDLKPCPWCGVVPTAYALGGDGWVSCNNKACVLGQQDGPEGFACTFTDWNRRSATPEPFDAFVPTTGHEGTIAQEILAQVAGMRKRGELNQSLCWSPEELELLAMFAINAKHDLARRSATPASPAIEGALRDIATAMATQSGRGLKIDLRMAIDALKAALAFSPQEPR